MKIQIVACLVVCYSFFGCAVKPSPPTHNVPIGEIKVIWNPALQPPVGYIAAFEDGGGSIWRLSGKQLNSAADADKSQDPHKTIDSRTWNDLVEFISNHRFWSHHVGDVSVGTLDGDGYIAAVVIDGRRKSVVQRGHYDFVVYDLFDKLDDAWKSAGSPTSPRKRE